MAVYVIKPGVGGLDTDGPANATTDSTSYTLGLQWRLGTLGPGESNPRVTEVHWVRAGLNSDGFDDPATMPEQCCLFDATTRNLVAGTAPEFFTATAATGWITQVLATPIAVDVDGIYRVGIYFPGSGTSNHYAAISHYFDTGVGAAGLDAGPVHVDNQEDAAPNGAGQGSFADMTTFPSGIPVYPGDQFNSTNYGIGFTIETDDAGGGTPHGAVSDAVAWTDTASGHRDPHGTAADSATWTTTATGHADHRGGVSDAVTWTVAAAGHAPTLGVPHGSITDAVTWTVELAGHTDPHGAAADSLAWTDAATGHAPQLGQPHGHIVDTVEWTVTATGHAPDLADPHGHTVDVVTWRDTANGHLDPHGHTADSVQWRDTIHGRARQIVTPAFRTYSVPVDSRTHVVPAEQRVYRVEAP